jgi:hypothetical protein
VAKKKEVNQAVEEVNNNLIDILKSINLQGPFIINSGFSKENLGQPKSSS